MQILKLPIFINKCQYSQKKAGPIAIKFDQTVRKTILQKTILNNRAPYKTIFSTKDQKVASVPLNDGFYVLQKRTKSSDAKLKCQVDKHFNRHLHRSKTPK